MNKYWFGKKRIGFGIKPISWEGYACLVVYIAVIVFISLVGARSNPLFILMGIALATIALAYVSNKTLDKS